MQSFITARLWNENADMLNLKQDWILQLKKGRKIIFDFDKPRKFFSTTSFLIGYPLFFSATPQREPNNISRSCLYFKNIEISFYKDAY
jgi:hypothetical protein